MPTSDSCDLISFSAAQTAQLGSQLGQLLAAGDLICLSGALGSGKTALAAGIGAGWGALEPVTSPTFVLVHEHHRFRDDLRLFHLDCYRLNSLDDAESVGIEDILAGDGIAIIEWPERIDEMLPPDRLWITLEMLDERAEQDDGQRHISFAATGARNTALLDNLSSDLTLNE